MIEDLKEGDICYGSPSWPKLHSSWHNVLVEVVKIQERIDQPDKYGRTIVVRILEAGADPDEIISIVESALIKIKDPFELELFKRKRYWETRL